MNATTIEQMPRGSYLVNTSRGGVVDVEAIPAAIVSGRLAGAGIDVLPIEPWSKLKYCGMPLKTRIEFVE